MSADAIVAALVLLGLASLIAVVGVVIGMLVAPRVGRLAEPHDEETGGDD
jgi:hypothetical protein